jgi:SAM-dependent methyltransferase
MTATDLVRLEQILDPSVERQQPPEGYETLQEVTREIAFDNGWSEGRSERVRQLFDGLAPEWASRGGPDRALPLQDALERGGLPAGGLCVEAGSGTSTHTPALAAHFDRVISFDLSAGMLAHAVPELSVLMRADSAALPFRVGSVPVIVCVNMFLFPAEVARALTDDGAVVFVSTGGQFTPIYLSAEDVLAALPGSWSGVTSVAGHGTWTVARRSV